VKKLFYFAFACLLLSHAFGSGRIVIPAESNPNVFLGQSYNSLTGKFLPIKCHTGPTKYVNTTAAVFIVSDINSIRDAISFFNNNFSIASLTLLHKSGGILPLADQLMEVIPHISHNFHYSNLLRLDFQEKALAFKLGDGTYSLEKSQFCQTNEGDHTKIGTHYVSSIIYGSGLIIDSSLRMEPGTKRPHGLLTWVNTSPQSYDEELKKALLKRSMLVGYRTTNEPKSVSSNSMLPVCILKNIEKCVSFHKFLMDKFEVDEKTVVPVRYVLTPHNSNVQSLSFDLWYIRGKLEVRLGSQLEKLNLFRNKNILLLQSTHNEGLLEELNSYRQWLEAEIIETREQIRYCYDHPYSYRSIMDQDLGCIESYENWILNRPEQSFPIISDPSPDLIHWVPSEPDNADTSGVLTFNADTSVCNVNSEALNLNLNVPYNKTYSYSLPPFLDSEEITIECTTFRGKSQKTLLLKSSVSAYINITYGSFGEYNGLDIDMPMLSSAYVIKNYESEEEQVLFSRALPSNEAPIHPSFLISVQKSISNLENSVLKITNPFSSFPNAEIQVKANHHNQEIIISCTNGCTSLMKKDYRYAY